MAKIHGNSPNERPHDIALKAALAKLPTATRRKITAVVLDDVLNPASASRYRARIISEIGDIVTAPGELDRGLLSKAVWLVTAIDVTEAERAANNATVHRVAELRKAASTAADHTMAIGYQQFADDLEATTPAHLASLRKQAASLRRTAATGHGPIPRESLHAAAQIEARIAEHERHAATVSHTAPLATAHTVATEAAKLAARAESLHTRIDETARLAGITPPPRPTINATTTIEKLSQVHESFSQVQTRLAWLEQQPTNLGPMRHSVDEPTSTRRTADAQKAADYLKKAATVHDPILAAGYRKLAADLTNPH